MENMYDVIIIGCGPAGLAAGLYSARAKMKTLILEKGKTGGQIVTTNEVANYPGSIKEATGPSLIARMVEQAEEFGAERKVDAVESVDFSNKVKVVKCAGGEYSAKSVIVATGATPRKLGVSGEVELTGKGVSYCATCDADFFTDLEVFVVGGGDSAIEEAMYLTKFARKVYVVHRRQELRAAKSIQEKAFKNEKIEFILDSEISEIRGEGIVESITLRNRVTGEEKVHDAHEDDGTFGIFPFVGYLPLSDLFKENLDMDDRGYLLTDADMKTNVDGVFAAGDIRQKSLRQVVTAVADGAIAAVQAEKYIENNFEE